MKDIELELVIGALLHDVGKVIYRSGHDHRKHSQSGYDFLKTETTISNKNVLDCVRYHHADALKNADLPLDSAAFIVYMADNIASSVDRREKIEDETGFDIHTPLQPVFNILNKNQGNLFYSPYLLNIEEKINYPVEEKKEFSEEQYNRIRVNIRDCLNGLEWREDYLNSLLEVLEANLSYIPCSTSRKEVQDISLYDHLKMTAAFSSCMYHFLEEQEVKDFKEKLWTQAQSFYREKAFMLASLDVSGIQKFIYTITTENALRMLRARSFYLEIMLEHIIDLILEKEQLSRANLIYSGGGHCYMLLPNTEEARKNFDDILAETNAWFVNNFQTQLYVAGACIPCSSEDLRNEPAGSYEKLFHQLSEKLSLHKRRRYTPEQIRSLNNRRPDNYSRECKICRTMERLSEDDLCATCAALKKFSANVLYADFFTILNDKNCGGLALPGDCYLVADNEKSLREKMETSPYFVRTYGKNRMFSGKSISTKLWVGNYTQGDTTEALADKAAGIDRIAILRADVDNLGSAFVSGFRNEKNQDRYVTISRTATLSRQLSLFFKLYINRILSEGQFSLSGTKAEKAPRNATIVYSGGDDLFIIGSWNEVIELSVDIKKCFEKYTEGTLTLSAGIGVYQAGFPVGISAYEVAEYEEDSKGLPGKNAVTLFPDGNYHRVSSEGEIFYIGDGTYTWKQFENKVAGEKLKELELYFGTVHDKGNAFLYHILELIRQQGERINFARYVYLLSRMEPENDAKPEIKQAYRTFSQQMYEWVQSEEDCRELKTAIMIYVYLHRIKEEEE